MPQIFLLTGTTTWTVPDDCVSVNIDTIGAGAGGDAVGGAGGGGAWSSIVGLAVTPRATITVQVGIGGASGSAGGDTWFNGASLGAASVGAKGGGAPTTTTGGIGGAAASRPNTGGTTGNSGGNGGSVATGNPGGGGGAAGLASNGGSGANGGASLGGSGGNGDNGLSGGGVGGLGSAAGTNPGGPGTEYDATHGSGGGGGGSITNTGGAGGNYGGGGGGSLVAGGAGFAGLIVINYVSVFVNKRPSAIFVRFEDASEWGFSSKSINRSLAATIVTRNVLRAPFYVPRPADESVWNGPSRMSTYSSALLQAFTAQKMFGAGGQVLDRNWGPLYTYDVGESNLWYPTAENRDADALLLLTATKFFGAPGQVPDKLWNPFYNYDVAESVWQKSNYHNKTLLAVTEPFVNLPWLWRFSQDDGPTWQGTPESYNSLTLDLLINTKFFGAPGQVPTKRWRYDYNDSPEWQGKPLSSDAIIPLLTAGGITAPNQWLFGHSDDSSWQQSNTLATATFYTLLNGIAAPFKQHPWMFNYDESSPWQGTPENYNSAIIQALTVSGQPPTKRWSQFYNYDVGESFWSWDGASAYQLTIPVGAVNPFIYRPWQANIAPDDQPGWYRIANKNFNLVSITEPFVNLPWLWKFDYDDSSGWSGAPTASALLIPILNKQPFTYYPWKFGQDDSSGWQSGSKTRNLNLTSITEPFINLPWHWKFSYDDASGWQGVPIASAILIPELVKKPFIYTPWPGGNEDPSGWQFGPRARNPNLVTVTEPFVNLPWQWKFNYDESSNWQGKPTASTLLVPVLTAQAPTKRWLNSYIFDDSSGWQFSSKNSNLLIPITTVGGQVKTKFWPHAFRDDAAFWLGHSVGTNKPLIITPSQAPLTRSWVYGKPASEAPAWQGFFWRNETIFFPPPTLITDPRFVTSPLPTPPAPWSGGSDRVFVTSPPPRVFVTTPLSRFPSMPYGNDFSVIDPLVELVTGTFNFDPWLAVGETITSILSITASNSKYSLTQDPSPQNIISGAPQIGPVPPAFPGTSVGIANRAVLQQLTNCQPGVVYLLQCLVMTSNNQKLNLANHLPCVALN